MIIWTGRGFLIAVIVFGCLLLSELLTEVHFQNDKYYQQNGWPKLADFLVSAAIVWILGGRWHGQHGAGASVQNHSMKKYLLRSQDALFFIPVRFWPYLLCLLGIVFFYVQEHYQA